VSQAHELLLYHGEVLGIVGGRSALRLHVGRHGILALFFGLVRCLSFDLFELLVQVLGDQLERLCVGLTRRLVANTTHDLPNIEVRENKLTLKALTNSVNGKLLS
jgi:hypothetical protein